MCGFVGFVNCKTDLPEGELTAIGRKMSDAISFRGPDDYGIWTAANHGVVLAHRRLSILDLSPEGHQPMVSESGRYVIIYNGEIYNFQDIQSELGNPRRYRSDTRVMLAAIERWGVNDATRRFNGIFAFALWDREQQQLSLVRDRLGIKPLYYGWQLNGPRRTFVFGSDILALRKHPDFGHTENPAAVSSLLRFGFIPAPLSIYSGINKLIPGRVLTLSLATLQSEPLAFDPHLDEITPYFDLTKLNRTPIASDGAVDQIDSALQSAVRRQLVSDVPIGAFLSGGIDSSLVVAMMRQVTDKVRTFSIGFETVGYDESATAEKIAEILGTDHTKFYLTEKEVIAQVPEVFSKLGEPLGDPSVIPTALVSKLARQHVTVALSGDGGDELFGGYNRYLFPSRVWNLRIWPRPLRLALLKALKLAPPSLINSLPELQNVSRLSDRLEKIDRMLCAKDIHRGYLTLLESHGRVSTPDIPRMLQLAIAETYQRPEETWMLFDQLFYLPDDNLCKVDRASMGHSLEVRVPLLDNEILALSHLVPIELKLRDGQTKWVLRQLLERYLPSEIVSLPKVGFTPPLVHWLRGPLRTWGADLLSSATDIPTLSRISQQTIWTRLQSSANPHDAALAWNLLVYWEWRGRKANL